MTGTNKRGLQNCTDECNRTDWQAAYKHQNNQVGAPAVAVLLRGDGRAASATTGVVPACDARLLAALSRALEDGKVFNWRADG